MGQQKNGGNLLKSVNNIFALSHVPQSNPYYGLRTATYAARQPEGGCQGTAGSEGTPEIHYVYSLRMKISKYNFAHENDVLSAISEDPDWDIFSNDSTIDLYRDSLLNGVTYVCYKNNELCGYVRAMLDDGFSIYISELYVIPKWRNHKIGQSLLERVKSDFSNLTVYALSDEDAYYVKKGYTKVGSVFEL